MLEFATVASSTSVGVLFILLLLVVQPDPGCGYTSGSSSVVVALALRYGRDFGFSDFDFWHWNSSFVGDRRQCNSSSLSPPVQTRITGGGIAEANMFPYQVALLMVLPPKVIQCGGALISPNYVITAAHCLQGAILGKVFLGTNLFANQTDAAAVFNVSSKDFHIHEKYVRNVGSDDIALIRLPKPAPLSERVQTIAVARSYMTQVFLENQTTTASGWGQISDNQTETNLLLYYVDAPVMEQQRCACFYLPGLVRLSKHVCVDGANGRGSCDGDSGGPLTYFHRGMNFLVGVTSFGSVGGCEIGFPSVYTRVTSYLGWIARITGIEVK